MKITLPKDTHTTAKKYITNVINVLGERNLLDEIDEASIIMLGNSYSTYLKATEQIQGNYTITNVQGNIVANPLIKIANDAQIRCEKIFKAFGLTSLDRKRLESDAPEEDTSLLSEFLSDEE